jgi:hypothetical protein
MLEPIKLAKPATFHWSVCTMSGQVFLSFVYDCIMLVRFWSILFYYRSFHGISGLGFGRAIKNWTGLNGLIRYQHSPSWQLNLRMEFRYNRAIQNIPTHIHFHSKIPLYHKIREEEFEDIKGVIRIRISKKNIQHNDPQKNYKRTNNDHKTYT